MGCDTNVYFVPSILGSLLGLCGQHGQLGPFARLRHWYTVAGEVKKKFLRGLAHPKRNRYLSHLYSSLHIVCCDRSPIVLWVEAIVRDCELEASISTRFARRVLQLFVVDPNKH